jgi:hypothetical protein
MVATAKYALRSEGERWEGGREVERRWEGIEEQRRGRWKR